MMSDKVQEHLNFSISELKDLLTEAIIKIEEIPEGGRKPGTKIAEELAAKRNIKWQTIYSMLKLYLFDNYPGIRCDKGAKGGLYRLTALELDEVKNADTVAKT